MENFFKTKKLECWHFFASKENVYFYSFYILFAFALLLSLYCQIKTGYAKESWQITEWLINYQGGFVRRGLLGEIFLMLHNNFGLSPYIVIISTSLLAYVTLVFFFIKSFIEKKYSLTLLPFVFFLGGPIINDFWVRKDVLEILIFIALVYLSIKKTNKYLIYVNLLFVVGLLMHESIGFFGFPIILLINYNKFFKTGYGFIKSVVFTILKLAPAILTFFVCLLFKGSPNISLAIWKSWDGVAFPIIQSNNYDTIPAAVGALAWSLKYGLSFSLDTLKNFNDGLYAPLVWFFIIILVYFFLTNFNKLNTKLFNYKSENNFDRINISRILIYQSMGIIPLFVLGWDYGRWVFLWIVSSFSILILIPDEELLKLFPEFVTKVSLKINNFLDSVFNKSKPVVYVAPFFLGVPAYSWSLSSCYNTMPIVIVLRLVSDFIHAFLN